MISTVARRRAALAAGVLAITTMAALGGCGSPDKPADTTPSSSSETVPTEKGVRTGGNNSFSPTVKARPAPTARIGGN